MILNNFFQNITSFKHSKHGGEVIFSKYCIIFMGNLWNSLGLTYLNQPKPDNLINKYSKKEEKAYFSPKIRLTFFGTKIKQLNHASRHHADFCLNSTSVILLNSN